jgi:hypothetical protein
VVLGRLALHCALVLLAVTPAQAAAPLLRDAFDGPDGLITNERVIDDADSAAPVSPTWIVTSGSLMRRDGWGWTGVPDAASPDVCSCRTTGSAVFRMVSRRSDLGDVAVALRLRSRDLTHTARTPAVATDGVHLMLRYHSEAETYYVSVQRRDGHVTIKRKSPGGPSNGGTYVTLADAALGPSAVGRVQDVRASAIDVSGGVALTLWVDGRRVLGAVDHGQGPGAALRAPGRIGVRADNADALFDDLVVTPARR